MAAKGTRLLTVGRTMPNITSELAVSGADC